MPLVIRIIAVAGGAGPTHFDGKYVVDSDVDANGGRGVTRVTADPQLAKRFASASEAASYYTRQSRVQPLRDDGLPNRPLTAFTVTLEPV